MEKQDIIKSFKDSLFTGLIALALFGPIVGLRTASKGEGLFITPQWGVVFLLVGLCILGRFLININSARKKELKFLSNLTLKFSNISEDRLKNDIQTLVNFGTRHTHSDTISETRGIGAARRWIKKEFELISNDCGECLEVFFKKITSKKII